MISMNSKSPIRGMDVDFADGHIYVTTFDGYLYQYKMNAANPSVNQKYNFNFAD